MTDNNELIRKARELVKVDRLKVAYAHAPIAHEFIGSLCDALEKSERENAGLKARIDSLARIHVHNCATCLHAKKSSKEEPCKNCMYGNTEQDIDMWEAK